MTEDELAPLRRYKPAEVVQLLNIPAKRLAAWVRENRVPYQCPARTAGFDSPPQTSGRSAASCRS